MDCFSVLFFTVLFSLFYKAEISLNLIFSWRNFKFLKFIYLTELNSKNILQILLHVWVLQFHSFADNSYSKKLVWFVV